MIADLPYEIVNHPLYEVFLPVPGWEHYQISNRGKLLSLKDNIGRARKLIIKYNVGSSGYYKITLQNKGKKWCTNIHNVVLLAFVGPRPLDKPHIRHLDGNKLNNNLYNIVYGTSAENAHDKILHRTIIKGSFHHSIKNPACMPRGLRHGSKTKPHATPRGSNHGNAIITEEIVRQIRILRNSTTLTQAEIANKFHITQSSVSLILLNKSWKHVK